jgi:hypothetical protein
LNKHEFRPTTYFYSYNSTAYSDSTIDGLVNTLRGKAFTFAFELTGSNFTYIERFISSNDSFAIVNSPGNLVVNNDASNKMVAIVQKGTRFKSENHCYSAFNVVLIFDGYNLLLKKS